MRWPYACYSFSDVENLGFHHYIQYMMMTMICVTKTCAKRIAVQRP